MKTTVLKIKKHRVIVDTDMLPILSQYTWNVKKDYKTFYATTNIKILNQSATLSMHRLLMGQRFGIIDHKNRNGLDNRIKNLRYADSKTSSYNRSRVNKLGYRGVYKASQNTYFCQIQKDGKSYRKYGFITMDLAAKAYDKLSRKLHGEFGVRNFKDEDA